MKTDFISITQLVADFDVAQSEIGCARIYSRRLRSAIYDTLTGESDVWVRNILLGYLDLIDANLARATG